MSKLGNILLVLIALGASFFIWVMTNHPAHACLTSACVDRSTTTSVPTRTYITDDKRRRVGDLYDPGNGRRIQIRNTQRQIIGYIEPGGRITNTRRQEIGEINE